jgi:hypothetical protein
MKPSWVTPIALVLTVLSYGTPAQGEELTLLPRFAPDPTVRSGKTRGEQPLGELPTPSRPTDGKCSGFGAPKPNLTLTLPREMPFLSLLVTTEANKTLNVLVRGPQGTFCREGTRATLAGTWSAGKYEIWIGGLRGSTQTYRLSLSELNQ